MDIKKGDTVIVLTGREKGKTGKILFLNPKTQRVIVEDINKKTRHERPSQKNQKGGILSMEAPIHISNVNLIVNEGGTNRPTRISRKISGAGKDRTKLRISKRTGEEV